MLTGSTYHKFLNHKPSSKQLENLEIKSRILEIYVKVDKTMGFRKIKIYLERDHCINISDGSGVPSDERNGALHNE